MAAIVDLFGKWSTLIGEMFAKYPLPAALVSAVGVLVFIWLQRERNPGGNKTASVIHAFVVLLSWAIIVPILGTILDVVVWITKALFAAASFLYGAYEKHPFFVAGVTATALIIYVVWEWRVKPRRPVWRAALTAVATLGLIALVVPVLDVLATKRAPVASPTTSTEPTPTTTAATKTITTTSTNASQTTTPSSTPTPTTTVTETAAASAIGEK